MGQRIIKRYSLAFKQQVIKEIEEGRLTISKAQKLYGISGGDTIQKWMKKFGKFAILPVTLRIQVPGEIDRIKELEKKVQTLESALAQAYVENVCLNTLIEVAGEHYQVDLKKNFGSQSSKGSVKKQLKGPV